MADVVVGSVAGLWRYPVKSMQGEGLDRVSQSRQREKSEEVAEALGLLCDLSRAADTRSELARGAHRLSGW